MSDFDWLIIFFSFLVVSGGFYLIGYYQGYKFGKTKS
jgi:hypothetical protein